MMANSDTVLHIMDMHSTENRLNSFKKWPLPQLCQCCPENLARAGFFHVPSVDNPDNVQCFYCCKELDGWEKDDDPLDEHKRHAKDCPFLKLPPYEEMLVEEVIKTEDKRFRTVLQHFIDNAISDYQYKVEKYVNSAVEKIDNLHSLIAKKK